MKKVLKSSFLLLALLSIVFVSCKKDYPEPPIQPLPIGKVYTIDSILAMESGTVFKEDASVYGIITADEQSGNLYKAAFMQDPNTGAALELHLDAVSGVRIGDSIRVYLKDVTYSLYNNLPQLTNFEADGHIVILANNKDIEPSKATIAEINQGKYLAGLVRLENVKFTEQNTFADPSTYGNRTLIDALDPSNNVIVRTSNYANFANDSLPQGTGNLVAIASVYNSTWQLYIRSAKELEFDDYVPGGNSGLPYFQDFATSFGTYTTYSVAGDQEWEIDYNTAKMTGHVGSNNYVNEDWLLSAPVALTNVDHVKVCVNYAAQYQNSNTEDVTLQISKNYKAGSDPLSADWTQMPVTYPNTASWSDFQTVETSLDEFLGETVTVAIKFVSSEKQSRTIEVKYILVQEGEPGNGPTPPTPPIPDGELQNMPYSQSFDSEFGTYIQKDVLGPQSWIIDYHTAKMTGFVSGSSNANEDWLISSPVAVTGVSEAKVSVNYAAQYKNSNARDVTLQVSTDYVFGNDPATATWTEMSATYPNTANWNDFQTVETSLNGFIGQNVTVAIKFTSTDSESRTIEIKSITVQEGHADGGETPPTPPTPDGELQNMPYSQSFDSEFGSYITKDVLGPQSWMIDYNTAKMTGYVSGSSHANEDWLISSPVAVTGVSEAKVSVNYAAQYKNSNARDVTLQVSTDYVFGNDPATATWTEMSATYPNTANWNDFQTVETSLNGFIGQNVTVAIKFTSTDSESRTIEIKSITVQEGHADGGETPPTPPTPDGELQNMPYSQSFDSEFGSYITKDVLGPQSWMIDYNTAKMTGYVSGSSHANEDWLISSPVAVTGVSDAKVSVNYAAQYQNSNAKDVTLQVSTNYVYGNDPTTATWTEMSAVYPNTANWSDFQTVETSLNDFMGQNVTVAIKFTSTDSESRTFEVKRITVQEGQANGGGDTPPTPPTPGEGEGSGTQADPYNVAAGIALQSEKPVAWVRGYIVGSVKSGNNAVSSNDQINWAAPFDLDTNVLIADDPDCKDVSSCIIVNLPAGKPLRAQVNLKDHPENLGKVLLVNGKLRTYFGQAGLRDSGGTESDFVLGR